MSKRRLEKLTTCPGVFKVMTLNEQTQTWQEPRHGALYRAFRYERVAEDKRKKVSKYSSSISLARAWAVQSQARVDEFTPPKVVKDPQAGMMFGELIENWL